MKDNWNELFDNLNEEDILQNLPKDMPEMEDELAAKRIEKKVMQRMQTERRTWSKSRIAAAVVGCLVAVGAFGHEPIMAAFQRLLYDLPGLGVYINDEDKEVYGVQIDDPVMEKDGVKVELLDFYCEDGIIHGKVNITGKDLLHGESDICDKSQFDALEEKYTVMWYYGDVARKMASTSSGVTIDDEGKVVRYTPECQETLHLDEGYDTYQIGVQGFEERITLKIVDPKQVASPDEIGYSVTKNENTITVRAAVTDEGIDLEYFRIVSKEVERAFNGYYDGSVMVAPYKFNFDNAINIITNADGTELPVLKLRGLDNGGNYLLEGTEEDFPITFHHSGFSGTNDESHVVTVPLPEVGKVRTKNLPKVEFEYGTVEFLSVQWDVSTWSDGSKASDRITYTYRTLPKDGVRQMYAVEAEVSEEYRLRGDGSSGSQEGEIYVQQGGFYLKDASCKDFEVMLKSPSYWIIGEYDVVVEKPME